MPSEHVVNLRTIARMSSLTPEACQMCEDAANELEHVYNCIDQARAAAGEISSALEDTEIMLLDAANSNLPDMPAAIELDEDKHQTGYRIHYCSAEHADQHIASGLHCMEDWRMELSHEYGKRTVCGYCGRRLYRF